MGEIMESILTFYIRFYTLCGLNVYFFNVVSTINNISITSIAFGWRNDLCLNTTRAKWENNPTTQRFTAAFGGFYVWENIPLMAAREERL